MFAGGDVTGDRATVVQAMAAGQGAAAAIDAYLSGAQRNVMPAPQGQIHLVLNEDALPVTERTPTPRLPVPERTFRGEDSATLTADALTQEPLRCANCGCVAVNASDLATALVALDAQVKTTQRTLAIGDLFAAAESKTTVLATDELIEEIVHPSAGSRDAAALSQVPHPQRDRLPHRRPRFPGGDEGRQVPRRQGRAGRGRARAAAGDHAVEALLEGRAPSAALADEAAALAVKDAQPLARNRAKVEIVKALVRQAVLTG